MVGAEEGDDVVMGREGQGFGLADGGAAQAGEGKPAAADLGHPDSMRDSETERVSIANYGYNSATICRTFGAKVRP